MAIILFDNAYRKSLFPLTTTKAIADLRWGILKIKEWWQYYFKDEIIYIHTPYYLQKLYQPIPQGQHIWIDAAVLPNKNLVDRICGLSNNEAIANTDGLIAGKLNITANHFQIQNSLQQFETIIDIADEKRLQQTFQLFQWNENVIQQQFTLITANKISQPISKTNTVIAQENIFIEEGATVEYSMLNATNGYIYIGKNAVIMEGCLIKGSLGMCNNAVLKMGAKIYGATTVGEKSVVGGEIKNAILGDYSNKAHDGYLGDSVIGEWCNIGAGTSNSNIKNNAGIVKLWSYLTNNYINANQKCGVIMGDYSRVAINSSINTGSSIGVCCNVFGNGLLPTLFNHFSWGTQLMSKYNFDKAIADIDNWKQLKGKKITAEEVQILRFIFDEK